VNDVVDIHKEEKMNACIIFVRKHRKGDHSEELA